MIARLNGVLLEKCAPYILIDVAGVGYELSVSMMTFYQLPEAGENITLFTHLSIREDAHVLFGFAEKNEQALFRQLIKVNGVGPKMALAILSNVDPDGFARCVHQDDVTSLVKIPGVGKKTAERLMIEMRDRLKEWKMPENSIEAASVSMRSASAEQDAINALVALGYKPQQAIKSVKTVLFAEAKSEELIRAALRQLA